MDGLGSGLDYIAELTAVNSKKIAVLGARAVVLSKFNDAVLPQLTLLQRAAISRSFREGIEEAMAAADDVALPAEYHSALLELTNALLTALG